MKIKDIIGKILKILGILIVVVPILIVIWVAIFSKPPTLSAKESFQKASEILKNQEKEAVFTKISTGSIPVTISGSVSSYKRKGRGNRWDICFYSKEEDKFLYFTNSSKEEVKEGEEIGRCKSQYKSEMNISKWKIDSEKAVKIANDKAKELEKEKFIIVKIELLQKLKDRPIWEIEFLPPKVGQKTTGLRIIINAGTGKIIRTEEPTRSYLSI